MKKNMTKFSKNVNIQTTAARNCGYIGYNGTVRLCSIGMTISNTTRTYSDLATDGTHIWIRVNNVTTVKYNGVAPTFTRSGNTFMITIPDNYDPTIPFVF